MSILETTLRRPVEGGGNCPSERGSSARNPTGQVEVLHVEADRESRREYAWTHSNNCAESLIYMSGGHVVCLKSFIVNEVAMATALFRSSPPDSLISS